jgi:hypothetical protein
MDDDYYLPHGPLHEHNRMVSEIASSSSDYLSYSLPDFHTEKTPKKTNGKSKQHHRAKTCLSKTKTQITEKEAKDAIMRGLITDTDDIDITKLSGKDKVIYILINSIKYNLRYINIISTRSTFWCDCQATM